MKTNAWSIGVIAALVLSGCTSAVPESNEIAEAPQETQLSFESAGWNCQPMDEYAYCSNTTFEGASATGTSDSELADVPFGHFMMVCWGDSRPSMVTLNPGSSWESNFDSTYLWNPVSYPNLTYSIDGGSKTSTAYEISGPLGDINPDTIYLFREWPNVMRDISAAKTLQIWLTDSTGTERQIDLDVEGSVSAVANLAAWGYGCDF
jgi:hypothetical protein